MKKTELRGTRTSKAGVPQLAGQLNTSSHIFGQNPRKRKLTEAPGTNPSKVAGGMGLGSSPRVKGGMTHDTAPYKHQAVDFPIGVGGPGFDEINE